MGRKFRGTWRGKKEKSDLNKKLKVTDKFKRILILGCGGSGKSTFSLQLSRINGLKIYHLDSLFWNPNWIPTPQKQWEYRVKKLIRKKTWIIDGSYSGTLALRLARADAVIFFDLSPWVCLWLIVKRRLLNIGRNRLGMPAGCPDRIYWSFVKWVWRYPQKERPKVLALLKPFSENKQVFMVKSTSDARAVLMNFTHDKGGL